MDINFNINNLVEEVCLFLGINFIYFGFYCFTYNVSI